jgi:hypothetical protein
MSVLLNNTYMGLGEEKQKLSQGYELPRTDASV